MMRFVDPKGTDRRWPSLRRGLVAVFEAALSAKGRIEVSEPSGTELVESPALDAAAQVGGARRRGLRGQLPAGAARRRAPDEHDGSIADRLLSGPVKLAEQAVESAANVFDLTIGNAGDQRRRRSRFG